MPDVEDAENAAEAAEGKAALKEGWEESQGRGDDKDDDTGG